MIVMGCDPAAGFGWAAYDLDRPPSAIESDSLKLPKGKEVSILDKLYALREEFVPLIRKYQPVFAAVEEPFRFIQQYEKRPERDMLTGVVTEPEGGETTMNPAGMSDAAQLVGAATALLLAWNVPCVQVRAQTWQTIIPTSVKARFPKPKGEKYEARKKRIKAAAKACCDVFRIASPNIDSRDAALIAMWAAGHQQVKLLQQRTEKAA
jgi:hypothetical protein